MVVTRKREVAPLAILHSGLSNDQNIIICEKKTRNTQSSTHNPHASLFIITAIRITMANNTDNLIKSYTTNTAALATDLIALLDRFVFLEGCTINAHPIQPSTTLPPLPLDDTPIAIQMYATPSLSSHLTAHDLELQESQLLATRIATLINLPSVSQAADKILDSEFAALPKPQVLKFPSLAAKLATLRNLQQRAAQPPRPQEFKTYIVTAINDAGSVDPFTIIHLPVTTDWSEYAEILTKHTQHPKTTADGFPDGYTLKEGRWFYQRIVKGRREEKLCDLSREKEFRGMRREMRREGIGVLIWHVSCRLRVRLFFRALVADLTG